MPSAEVSSPPRHPWGTSKEDAGEFAEVGAGKASIFSEKFPKRRLVNDFDSAAVGRKLGRLASFCRESVLADDGQVGLADHQVVGGPGNAAGHRGSGSFRCRLGLAADKRHGSCEYDLLVSKRSGRCDVAERAEIRGALVGSRQPARGASSSGRSSGRCVRRQAVPAGGDQRAWIRRAAGLGGE